MVWNENHEVLLCREVRLRHLYQYKDGSRERCQCLDRISESLKAVPTLWLKVDQRALRDKLNKLLKDYIICFCLNFNPYVYYLTRGGFITSCFQSPDPYR